MRAGAAALLAAAALGTVAWDFFSATTFTGDDHLFLSFARHTANPMAAFVSDQHGGEYYRPLPMLLWWALARLGQYSRLPFAVAALLLHGAVAVLIAALGRAGGRTRGAAIVAAVFFWVSPAQREAALWFSASTDLLATAATLGSIVALLRGMNEDAPRRRAWRAGSVLLAAVAYFSKESALVLPGLAALAVFAFRGEKRPPGTYRDVLVPVAGHVAAAAIYLGARGLVLGGWGGTGDPSAPLAVRALQILAGLVDAMVGHDVLPSEAAWVIGSPLLIWAVASGFTRPVAGTRLFPLLWMGLAVLPLPAAGWIVGPRYFYLPSVGLALLVADRYRGRGRMFVVLGLAGVVALGVVQTIRRQGEVNEYDARVAAAADAVATGMKAGHRVFHIKSGIKDLDLAVKHVLRDHAGVDDVLVLCDVPASFVLLPEALADRAAFLFARPPLPPGGAYVFGGRKIVGLARRADAPDLADVIARLPEIRFLELVHDRRGKVVWRVKTFAP